ncbi:hypothetical protein L0P54_03300 [Anaerosalibacter bizertensis]|uniref:Uncharacterized protein n=1 Tax=Anaerosalibacter bizertensis TaxID=932217 RepID=A0A9Q4FLY8_9FIRM|nr:hypothetical protein [Anaerosalibacter bizertensis]MBV1817989.1 hypothetical protein [Bacteroidales bacterium MSK.15.36]MCB5559346.1 hypothetical protein [Anaerosalibacter bizertensis]MCG4565207.1 hypothetical protein [Anaerosalibacter bizertensis]MCG4582001.1 hypothetical protein [Anaerosalibacter bizertensis]MCG4586290.1 hypothetical protein [Anaerosalibacter bizertensis]
MTDREILESILREMTSMKDEMTSIKSEMTSMKDEMTSIKSEMTSLDEKLTGEMASMKGEMSSIKDEIKWIKEQQKEDHSILKALMHNSEINKAEHDKMSNDIAHIQGYLKNVDENLEAVKDIIGRHEVDIKVLKNRSV